jgi:hypothetical protein
MSSRRSLSLRNLSSSGSHDGTHLPQVGPERETPHPHPRPPPLPSTPKAEIASDDGEQSQLTLTGNHTTAIAAVVDHLSLDMNSKSDADRSKITPSPQHTRAMTARGSTCLSPQGADSKSRTGVQPSTQHTLLHDKTTQTLVRLLSQDIDSKGSKGRTRHTRPPNSTQHIYLHVETTTRRITTILSSSDTRHRRHLIASTRITLTRHHSI